MGTLLAKNADVVVTMDGQRRELRNAGLFARDGMIEKVAPTAELPPSPYGDHLQYHPQPEAWRHDCPFHAPKGHAKHITIGALTTVKDSAAEIADIGRMDSLRRALVSLFP
jgi:hypothetical protein